MNAILINMYIGGPPSFSCYKTTSHHSESKIHYTDCTVTTPGMDPASGVFKVQEPGVYQFTFTGFFVSLKGHMVSTDIYLRRGKDDKIIGRGSAKSEENGTFGLGTGTDDNLHSTISIVLQERLQLDDQVLVSMVIHGDHGSSKIDSDFSRKIIFTGLKISD